MIRAQIAALAAANDALVEEDPELLEEVVYLLEYLDGADGGLRRKIPRFA